MLVAFAVTDNIAAVTAMKTPMDERYILCSKSGSTIGMTLDSTESVMKNHNMPKAMRRK